MQKEKWRIGGATLLFVAVLAGCASLTEDAPPGALAIVGIPSEYEGKYISVNIWNIPNPNSVLKASTTIANGDAVVKNGEAQVWLYKKVVLNTKYGWNDSGDHRIEVMFTNSADNLNFFRGRADAVFPTVHYEEGVAGLNWSQAIMVPVITISNIPAEYRNGDCEVFLKPITSATSTGPLGVPITITVERGHAYDANNGGGTGIGTLRNGVLTVKIIGTDNATTTTGDILICLSGNSGDGKTTDFLFKDVQIVNSKADLDFSQGESSPF